MIKLTERLVYIKPDGSKYLLHAPPSRVVLSEEGFGTPPLEYVVNRAPFQHGDTVKSFHLGPRPVQVVVLHNFCSRDDYWTGRNALEDALRPNRVTDLNSPGKLLYYLPGGRKRQLDVWLESGPGFSPPEQGWRQWSFTEAIRFVAHDPVWYDPSLQTTTFVQSVGELVFPATFPIVFGGFGSTTDLEYVGTWLEYPTIVITGPIIGPSVRNLTTDKSIGLGTTIPAGMFVTITLSGQKSVVRSDGANLLNYVTEDSDLTEFALVPDPEAPGGVNQIQVSGSDATVDTSVVIQWYKRYFGI